VAWRLKLCSGLVCITCTASCMPRGLPFFRKPHVQRFGTPRYADGASDLADVAWLEARSEEK
jgi:hypothetical protein